MIHLQNGAVLDLLRKQAVKLKREERTWEEQVSIVRSIIPIYLGLDRLLENDRDSYQMMDQIYEKITARVR